MKVFTTCECNDNIELGLTLLVISVFEMCQALLTSSSISFVCAADKQNLARDSIMGVAGKPTTTIPSPLFKHSLPNALK